jgi:hypothetical protein
MVESLRRIASMFECKLHSSKRQTAFGGLCLLGRYLIEEGAFKPLSGVKIDQKTVRHSPANKLTDALMSMLSGCKAIYQTNVRVRPDVPLGRAFGRQRVADQSTIQRTLDAFSEENVSQLREAVEAIGGATPGCLPTPTSGRCSSWRST